MQEEALAVVEENDLTADLTAAWDASENDNGSEQQGSEVSEPLEQPEIVTDSGISDSGGDEEVVEAGQEEIRPDGEGSVTELVVEANEKPPVGLSLESREAWKDVPDAVKKDIVKREADYEKGIVQYSQQAKRAEAMDRSLQPYQQYFEMNGGAGQSIQSLLQTGSALQMGSPIQKAQVAANIIKQFGIDIKTLDSMLVGENAPQEVQQQNQFEQMIDQRLGPMQQQLQQYQQREQNQNQQAQDMVASEVNTFGANNEFYNDVRGDMADLMDMAANRGREMSMEEAYKITCSNHPQIAKIISGRASQQSVDSKKRAATSISGTPGGIGGGQQSGSIAAALNDAWDGVGRA